MRTTNENRSYSTSDKGNIAIVTSCILVNCPPPPSIFRSVGKEQTRPVRRTRYNGLFPVYAGAGPFLISHQKHIHF